MSTKSPLRAIKYTPVLFECKLPIFKGSEAFFAAPFSRGSIIIPKKHKKLTVKPKISYSLIGANPIYLLRLFFNYKECDFNESKNHRNRAA